MVPSESPYHSSSCGASALDVAVQVAGSGFAVVSLSGVLMRPGGRLVGGGKRYVEICAVQAPGSERSKASAIDFKKARAKKR